MVIFLGGWQSRLCKLFQVLSNSKFIVLKYKINIVLSKFVIPSDIASFRKPLTEQK